MLIWYRCVAVRCLSLGLMLYLPRNSMTRLRLLSTAMVSTFGRFCWAPSAWSDQTEYSPLAQRLAYDLTQ